MRVSQTVDPVIPSQAGIYLPAGSPPLPGSVKWQRPERKKILGQPVQKMYNSSRNPNPSRNLAVSGPPSLRIAKAAQGDSKLELLGSVSALYCVLLDILHVPMYVGMHACICGSTACIYMYIYIHAYTHTSECIGSFIYLLMFALLCKMCNHVYSYV